MCIVVLSWITDAVWKIIEKLDGDGNFLQRLILVSNKQRETGQTTFTQFRMKFTNSRPAFWKILLASFAHTVGYSLKDTVRQYPLSFTSAELQLFYSQHYKTIKSPLCLFSDVCFLLAS